MVSTSQQRGQRMWLFSFPFVWNIYKSSCYFSHASVVVCSARRLVSELQRIPPGPVGSQSSTPLWASTRITGLMHIALRVRGCSWKCGAKGWCSLLHRTIKSKWAWNVLYWPHPKKPLLLFCTAKTKQALSAPGRRLHRENSVSNVTCSEFQRVS